MYYIRDGLHQPKVASLFAIVALCASLTVGNLVQMNSLVLPLQEAFHPYAVSVVSTVVMMFLLRGSGNRLTRLASKIVPLMALSYLVPCFFILLRYADRVPHALALILKCAFARRAAVSGAAGYTLLQALHVGFNRGLVATDAGAGLEAMIHASVTERAERHEVAFSQGLITCIAPLFVAFLCTVTALVLLVTGVWQDPSLSSTLMCVAAFRRGLRWSSSQWFLTGVVFCFVLTTMATWSFCCDRAFAYLWGSESRIGRRLFLGFVPLGSLWSVERVWQAGDLAFNLMLSINVVCVLFLSCEVIVPARQWLEKQARSTR